MKCRSCETKLEHVFIDLANSPISNMFLTKKQLNEPEIFYPLKVFICTKCKLVQIDEYMMHDNIFNKDYAYFSSYSTSWLTHAKYYVSMITEKLSLHSGSLVTEIASNDGYLLQYFNDLNIPCIGIEPTASTAKIAKEKNIAVVESFFSSDLAKKLKKSDLIIGNNVLAHVPNINDFVEGLKILLKNTGTITIEFPHILNMIKENQFDVVYHEHFSYLSFFVVQNIFKKYNLTLYNVEKISTHGGSLRVYAAHTENINININNSVNDLLLEEKGFSLLNMKAYTNFQHEANKVKNNLLEFLLKINKDKKVIAYGAAAKGNTFLNYAGIKSDLIKFVVDKSPHKQGKYLPASHIPIVNEKEIKKYKPDYILILPWNIKNEIIDQLAYVTKWGCKFIVAIPSFKVIE